MELGIYTFADFTPDPITGQQVSGEQRMRDLMEEIELADQVGLDIFGVGEHHRPDFAISAPEVVLAASPAARAVSEVQVLRSVASGALKLMLVVQLDQTETLLAAHEVSTVIEQALRERYHEISRFVIHTRPVKEPS